MVDKERLIIERMDRPLREVALNETPAPDESYTYHIDAPGTLQLPELGASMTVQLLALNACPDLRSAGQRTAFFDMETVSFPMTVRNPKPEDRFTPFGMKGRQKVRKYLKDRKIPASRRARHPVLESGGKIIWLIGCRPDDTVRITDSTKQVLKIDFCLA